MILKWKKTKKIFSVVIPVYNGEKTIERALASLISNKEYIKDIIIVDDCCTDKTKSVVSKYDISEFLPIKYIRNNSRSGTSHSRKTGMENADGEWITFIDADDCLTAGSLKYVYDLIKDNNNLKILHCQTVYYESGTFNSESINYSDTSCGGNFYNLKFLTDNNLYPHDTLPLVEDQYFNEKIMYFIDFCYNNDKDIVGHFDYPVYEVHHDVGIEKSYAIRNWEDYCCRYRLLYKQYLVDDYIGMAMQNQDLYEILLYDYLTNIIFVYCLSKCLEYDEDLNFVLYDNIELFSDAIDFMKDRFNVDESFLIYIFNNKELFDEIANEARETTDLNIDIDFNINEILGDIN